jgi:hypothetical protein
MNLGERKKRGSFTVSSLKTIMRVIKSYVDAGKTLRETFGRQKVGD